MMLGDFGSCLNLMENVDGLLQQQPTGSSCGSNLLSVACGSNVGSDFKAFAVQFGSILSVPVSSQSGIWRVACGFSSQSFRYDSLGQIQASAVWSCSREFIKAFWYHFLNLSSPFCFSGAPPFCPPARKLRA